MKHGLISVAGWAALACWVITFLLEATMLNNPKPTSTQIFVMGGFGWAAILLTVCWGYGRWWWWKEKTRARAWREGLERDKRI